MSDIISGNISDIKKIVLLGGGGHCKSVLDTLLRMESFWEPIITDTDIPAGDTIMGCKVIGSDDILQELCNSGITHACIAVGNIKDTKQRHAIYDKAEKAGFKFPNIIDPSAAVSESAEIGKGVFIGKNAAINAASIIDDMAIINTGAIVEHDCHIGSFVHIAVGAVVCGGVEIGSDSFIGAGATIIQGVRIGMNSVIGAGSTILRDVPENTTVVGVWGGYTEYEIMPDRISVKSRYGICCWKRDRGCLAC